MNQSQSTNSYVLLLSENLLNKTNDQTQQELISESTSLYSLLKKESKNCIVFLSCRVVTMDNETSLMHSLNSKSIWN